MRGVDVPATAGDTVAIEISHPRALRAALRWMAELVGFGHLVWFAGVSSPETGALGHICITWGVGPISLPPREVLSPRSDDTDPGGR